MKEVMVHIYRKIKQISSPFFRSCCLVTFKKSRGHLPLVTFGYYQDGGSLISSFSRSSKMAAMSNSRPWGRHAQSIFRPEVASSPFLFPGPSRLRRSLARSRAARFARPNRRACSQATQKLVRATFVLYMITKGLPSYNYYKITIANFSSFFLSCT